MQSLIRHTAATQGVAAEVDIDHLQSRLGGRAPQLQLLA